MNTHPKKIFFSALTIILLGICTVNANTQNCYESCQPTIIDSCDWKFCHINGTTFEAEALLWKPCIDDLDYAAKVHTTGDHTHVQYASICPDWEAGIRLTYEMPSFAWDWGFSTSYSIIDFNDNSKIVKAGSITSPIIHPSVMTDLEDKAYGSWELCYHDWEILLNYDISCNQCHHIKPYFGFASIFLHQRLKTTFVGERDYEVKWKSRYRGYGLRAGTEYQYKINNCIRLFSKADATLLAGEAKTKNEQSYDDDLELKDDDCCHFLPGFHIAAGLLYDMRICDVNFTIRLGYEFVEWFNVPNHRVFIGDDASGEVAHSTSPSTRTLGFHGLQGGIRMTF